MRNLKFILSGLVSALLFCACTSKAAAFSIGDYTILSSNKPSQGGQNNNAIPKPLESLQGRFYLTMDFGTNVNLNDLELQEKLVKKHLDGFGFDISMGYHVTDSLAVEGGYTQQNQEFLAKGTAHERDPSYLDNDMLSGHVNLAYEIPLTEHNRAIFKTGALVNCYPKDAEIVYNDSRIKVRPFFEIGYGYRINNNVTFNVEYEGELDFTGTHGLLASGVTYYM